MQKKLCGWDMYPNRTTIYNSELIGQFHRQAASVGIVDIADVEHIGNKLFATYIPF